MDDDCLEVVAVSGPFQIVASLPAGAPFLGDPRTVYGAIDILTTT